MNAIILKGAALRQPPLPQSGPRAKTIAHPCIRRLKGNMADKENKQVKLRIVVGRVFVFTILNTWNSE
jgi:hypothetical protein